MARLLPTCFRCNARGTSRRPRCLGFSLVELLVVIAIIGVLLALILPAISAARESSRRLDCVSRLRQLGIAVHNYESSHSRLPAGSIARAHPAEPSTPHTFYRWSSFAQLLPYLELTNLEAQLDLNLPLYTRTFTISEENRPVVQQVIPLLLCPSDRQERVHEDFGPTNYAACSGNGNEGGTPLDANGVFYINSYLQLADVIDGTSNTAFISECLLGETVEQATPRELVDVSTAYVFTPSAPLRESSCESSSLFNYTDPPSFAWANGEYRSSMYNHYRTPNSPEFDCVSAKLIAPITERYAAFGWRSTRSRHPGGVNTAMGDGSVQFYTDEVDLEVWQALSTRASTD